MGKTGIVFIPGAGLNSTIWNEVKAVLDIPVLTIDFPKKASGKNSADSLTFDDYVTHAATQIDSWNGHNFVIAAHSIGALIGLKLADPFKERLNGFVAISSVIPTNGNSFISSLQFPQKLILPVILHLFGTRPPQNTIENELCNDLSAVQTQKILNDYSPESKALYTTKISYHLPAVKRLYIELTKDKSMPVALQKRMAKQLKADKISVIESGHLPMLSKPKELAAILSEFAKSNCAE